MTTKELRQKYLDFFASKGHAIIPSASLIPENDPTVLFTTAGMHPLVPYLLGEKHPEGNKLANAQKCIRTGDIDEVGDNAHLTFFEMLGNWSLGDYFKEEAIKWSWEFLTSDQWLALDPKKLAVSVFKGDDDAPKDEESAELWHTLGVPKNKIAYLSKKENWWGPAGETGPCGPDTEIFYWVGIGEYPPEISNPGNDKDNWLEIWNDVFMQYNKRADGSFNALEKRNVDTGMGLERTVAVLNGYDNVYVVDTIWPVVSKVMEIAGVKYEDRQIPDGKTGVSVRIITDHIRAAAMIMADKRGVAPGNTDQAYVVRRLIRRSIRHAHNLGLNDNFCSKVAERVLEVYKDIYREVLENREFVLSGMEAEETTFRKTLDQGIKQFEKLVSGLRTAQEKTGKRVMEISGKQAFKLYDTYGFPLEMTEELAAEHNLTLDRAGFQVAFEKHQELSRAGAEKKFKGGLADASKQTTALHTVTHLLQAALRQVLGEHVEQRGSNITADRLRFDFSHPDKMTEEQKNEVEKIVNEAIKQNLPVTMRETTVEEARKLGAIGLFADKYDAKVKVYTIGNPNSPFSREICGGPHAKSTGELGVFKIKKEEASSAGVRRIKAILE